MWFGRQCGDARSSSNACFPFAAQSRPRVFALIALELACHAEQRAKDDGAIIAGELHDAGLDHQAAEFDQMPRALAALDLPATHVMPGPSRLMPAARR